MLANLTRNVIKNEKVDVYFPDSVYAVQPCGLRRCFEGDD